MSVSVSDITPMMKQYLRIKESVPDAILMFRIGDFYEMLQEDAILASRVLGITLTKKHMGSGKTVPLAGVPYHSVQPYIRKLTQEGYRVAVCEQTTEPMRGRKIVEREVVRTITPGTLIDADALGDTSNNYLAAVYDGDLRGLGLAYTDISTGEFRVTVLEGPEALEDLRAELIKILPSECLLPRGTLGSSRLGEMVAAELKIPVTERPVESFSRDATSARDIRLKYPEEDSALRQTQDRGPWPQFSVDLGLQAAGAILSYLKETQRRDLSYLDTIEAYQTSSFMALDSSTARNLELLQSIRQGDRRGTLFGVLDRTLTPMGCRLLKRWLMRPLTRKALIESRLEAVAALVQDSILRQELRSQLAEMSDLERLVARACFGNANARDLLALRLSLEKVPRLRQRLFASGHSGLRQYFSRHVFDEAPELVEELARAVVDEPPLSVREGGIIRPGYHRELDDLRTIQRDGKGWIAGFQATERQRTGISSLKVGYNKVFGYYIEVTKANLDKVPGDYIRKQTLTGGERYITESLKEYESRVLGAQERMAQLEYELFIQLREKAAGYAARIRTTAAALAELDVLCSYAETAAAHDYCRPEILEGPEIEIRAGRHPVLEQSGWVEHFVPNDLLMDGRQEQLYIITGPNMAGKSTYIRQVALIVLMAQIGSFVPACSARIGWVDQIFTRVGASDNLVAGQSTFMVEMSEAAHILKNATPRSLVILDEIGRGTSTFDGVSLAWAIAEYLHGLKGQGVKTLFATHYHELAQLGERLPRARNFRVLVSERDGRVTFLYQVAPGSSDHSYGIHVAELAGLPKRVLDRARKILHRLEQESVIGFGESSAAPAVQLSLFSMVEEPLAHRLRELDVNQLSPMEALQTLAEMVEEVKRKTSLTPPSEPPPKEGV